MKITEIISEAAIGTTPKRPARTGSRPDRGHEAQPRYKTSEQGVAEGTDERKQNALWAQITAHEKAAKKSKDLKQQHHLKMADQLRSQLKTSDMDEGFDYTMKDLGNDYAGFPSNHSLKHKMLKRISPEHHQLYKDKINNTHDSDQLMKLFHVAKARGHVIDEQGVAEAGSNALADTAKRLTDPKDGQVAKLRAAGDKKRQGQIQQQQSYGRADENKAPRSLCVSSKPDEDLGASQLASCKSQGLRARDGNKSHKLGKTSKSRVKVGGKRIKGNKYGGPLPDWS